MKTATTEVSTPQDQSGRWSGWLCLLIVLFACAARAWLLFSTPLVPGMNGGYYLIQSRALLESGHLGIPDLPLTFVLQAGFARILQWLTGGDLETSIVLAVKLADSVLPALVAIPIFWLGRAWAQRLGRSTWLALAAAAVAAAGAPALSMVGDFEKNSLGLVWMAGLVWALARWIETSSSKHALTALALLGLVGLTHIGVFGGTLLLATLIIVARLLLRRCAVHQSKPHRRAWPVVVGAVCVASVAAGIVLWKFDPARVNRLVGAFTNPSQFLTSGGPPHPQFAGGQPPATPRNIRPPHAPPGGPPNDRFPGGPPPNFMPHGFPTSTASCLFAGVAGLALVIFWRRRRVLPVSDGAVALGCSFTVLLMTGPWVQGDKAGRFYLIAMVPAIIAAMFALMNLERRWLRGLGAALLATPIIGASVPLLMHGGQPVISTEEYRELKSLSAKLPSSQHTLVVAHHGLEWWTAWTLHTHVAQAKAVRAEDWKTYENVLFLQSKGRGHRFGPQGGGFGPPPGPPPFGFAGGPPPPEFGPPGDFPGGPPPPMGEANIPDDAEILHKGENFVLAKVATPPTSIGSGPREFDRP